MCEREEERKKEKKKERRRATSAKKKTTHRVDKIPAEALGALAVEGALGLEVGERGGSCHGRRRSERSSSGGGGGGQRSSSGGGGGNADRDRFLLSIGSVCASSVSFVHDVVLLQISAERGCGKAVDVHGLPKVEDFFEGRVEDFFEGRVEDFFDSEARRVFPSFHFSSRLCFLPFKVRELLFLLLFLLRLLLLLPRLALPLDRPPWPQQLQPRRPKR